MAIAELSSPSSLSPSPSAEWDTLGNTEAFYRRTLLYSLDLVLPGGGDLSDYLLAGARNGGPLAITRDDSKPVLLKEAASSSSAEGGAGRDSRNRKRVWLYTSAGILIQSIVWDHSAKLVKFGFTTNESLVLLGRDGVYRLYPISPALSSASSSSSSAYSQHSLTHDVGEDAFISDARIYEGGMLILLSTHQFLEVKGWPERDDALVAADAWDAGQSPAAGSSRAASAGLGTIYGKGRVERLVDSGLERAPSAWCVLTPEQSTSRQAEVLMSSGEALLVVDQLEVQDQRFSRGPFSHIVPSPSGRFMALLTVSAPQRLYVVSSNYSETLSEYSLADEPETGPPKSVKWCGNNSVVLAWESTVVMVGPYGQTLRYYYTDPIHLVNEVDGVRIISIDKCEFLQKVPPSTVAVFSPGSSHPSAILFEAYNEFSARSAHSHESIISIRPDLVEAVDTCIDAAAREVDPAWQKKLLKAAGFGKTFLDSYNPIDFVNVAQALRVLNAVRHYEIGIPITYDQYLTQSPASLVARLILRSRHLLALRISGFLKLSASPVLRHWARQKVTLSKNEPDDAAAVCDLIVRRLRDESDASSTTSANARVGTGTGNGTGGSDVSCADVARTAWDQGKVALATRLLEHEARASKQVHLLLSMREDNLALLKATQSGDSDLILSVLLSLRKQHSLGTFFRFLDNKPEAAAVLANYGRRYDRELIRDYWYQDDRRTESACFDLEEAARIGVAMPGAAAIVGAPPGAAPGSASADTAASREALTAEQFGERMDKVRSAMKTFGEDKERGFEARICDEHLKLLAFQQTLQSEAGAMSSTPLVGLSVNETIRQCLVHGWGKKAEKLRADFKVPDKRWWYVKVKALTETRDWEALDQFVRSKSRPPIPLEAVVDHLIATGNPRQAIKYVPKCEGRNRPELFVKAGEWVKAGEECRDRGDRAKLQDLINRAPNNLLGSQLASMLEDTRSF